VSDSYSLDDFRSDDDAMATCLGRARLAARTELPILILGETGTGKTMLARAIHNSSPRARAAFISFNSAALSDTLLDSQLFGHEKGAFTGAVKRVRGKFEQADKGTLFLDEIADMSAAAQAKILRAVEYGEYERLGGEELLHADVRLVSATHLPLAKYLELDHFRKDLFYRISGITLRLPPLRERPNDLRSIVAAAIQAAGARTGKRIVGLSRAAAETLFGYHWPGNLRQLQRVVSTAVALADGEVILPEHLLIENSSEEVEAERASGFISEPTPALGVPAAPRPGGSVRMNGAAAAHDDAPPRDDLSLRAAESRHIHAVLQRFDGNKRRTARALGVSRTTLDRKLHELHLPLAE
jgi:transcriptional regulator with PAS, ATPase and Fis domain